MEYIILGGENIKKSILTVVTLMLCVMLLPVISGCVDLKRASADDYIIFENPEFVLQEGILAVKYEDIDTFDWSVLDTHVVIVYDENAEIEDPSGMSKSTGNCYVVIRWKEEKDGIIKQYHMFTNDVEYLNDAEWNRAYSIAKSIYETGEPYMWAEYYNA